MSNPTYNNGLIPVPKDSPIHLYCRLASQQALWFYDDHQQVLHLQPSQLTHKPGFLGLVYNRDTRTLNSTHYKFLGDAFLTTPQALANTDLSEDEIRALAYLRGLGYIMPILAPEHTQGVPSDALDQFEEAVESQLPLALQQFMKS